MTSQKDLIENQLISFIYMIQKSSQSVINSQKIPVKLIQLSFCDKTKYLIGFSSNSYYTINVYSLKIEKTKQLSLQIYDALILKNTTISVIATKYSILAQDILSDQQISEHILNTSIKFMSTYMLSSNTELVSFVTDPISSGQISIYFWEPIQNISYGSIQMNTKINEEISIKKLIGIKKYFGYDYAFIYLVSETVYLYDLTNYQQQQFQLLSSFSVDQLYYQYGLSDQIQPQQKFFSGLLISYYQDFLRVTTFDTNGNNFVLKFPKIYNNTNTQQLVISYHFNQNNWTQITNNPLSEYIYIINNFQYVKYYIGENMTIERIQQYFSQKQSSQIASKLANFDGEERQIIIFNQINNKNQIQIADKYGNIISFFEFDIYTLIPQISFSFQEVVNLEKIQFSIKINSTQLLVFDTDSQQISYFNVSLSPQFNWSNQPEFYQVIHNPETNFTHFYIVNGLTKQLSRVKLIPNDQSFLSEIFDQSKNQKLSPGFSIFIQQQIAVALASNQIIEYDLYSLQLKSFTNTNCLFSSIATTFTKLGVAIFYCDQGFIVSYKISNQYVFQLQISSSYVSIIQKVEGLNLVFLSFKYTNIIEGYSLDPSSIELNKFLIFQNKYNILGFQFTKSNMLFINTDQQNIQFDAFGCLDDNQCKICELKVYLDSQQLNQDLVDNFGQRDLNQQFTTYQNFILGFLQVHQLLQFIKTIQTVQIHYFINSSNDNQIDQNLVEFQMKEKIILIIEPVQILKNNSVAVVNISGNFSLSLFQSIIFKNIIFKFSNQYQIKGQPCSLNLINIQSISIIDNVTIIGGSEQDQIFCFNFKIQKSNVEFKNFNLYNLNLSNHSSMITATNQEENFVKFSNLTIQDSILDQFSLFVSESFTNLILEDINIINNNSSIIDELDFKNPSYIFQSSGISVKNMTIQNNVFKNINIIIKIQQYMYAQVIQMEIVDIYIQDNILNQIQSTFFMQALYDEIQVPTVILNIQNIIISNNSITEDIYTQKLYDLKMFQIQKIKNISIQNIQIIDNYNFGLGLFKKIQILQVNNFNCSFSNNYQIKIYNVSSSCLIVEDGSQVKIQNFLVDQKILSDNFALFVISPEVSSQVLIENIQISNIQILQSGLQIFAEPIYINLNFGDTVQINNFKAFNCTLIGQSSSSVSTPVLYILNLRGSVNIHEANLYGIFSNSINNGLVINANSLNISSSFFIRLFYIDYQQLNYDGPFYHLSKSINTIGSCFQFTGTQLFIQDSQFNETQSNKGGFGYLQNLINNQINLKINNCTFSNSATNFQGSSFYISLQKGTANFEIFNSTFNNILSLNQSSVSFYVESTESKTNRFQFQQLTLRNIYGVLNSFIFSLNNAQIQCNNITIIEDINENSDIQDFLYQQFLQFGSLFYLMNSNAQLQNIFLSQIQTIQDFSPAPLLINAPQNCFIKLTKCQISNSLFSNQGLIFLNNSFLQSSDITIKNMTLSIPQRRQVQYTDKFSGYINSYFIFISSSNVFLNLFNVSFFKCKTCYGGFMLSQNSSLTIVQSTFQNLEGSIGGAIYLTDNQDTIIQDCIFQQIEAYQDGGALFVQNQLADKTLSLINIKCYQNKSVIGKGGCINIEMTQNDQNVFIQNSLIEQNNAQIGGGISFSDTVILFKNNTIQNNFAKSYGNNIFFAPSSLFYQSAVINKNADITVFKDLLIIKNVQSGFNIQELKFVLQGEDGQYIFYQQFTKGYLEVMENPPSIVKIISNSSYNIIGSLQSHYNENLKQFIFNNLTVTAKAYTQINLIIRTNLIKTFNYTNNQIKDDYFFNVTILISECQVGYTPQIGNDGIPQCLPCKDGSYSFNSVACLKCPIGGICINGEKDIKIQDGYWRLNQQDDGIILCQNKMANCIARNHSFSGNDICKRGYVGALCESCDYYGERWGQRYIRIGQYQCALCEIAVQNILKLILIYLGIILSVTISIRSYINQIRKFILCSTVVKLSKSKKTLKEQYHSGMEVTLKIMGTYIQSIFAISQLQIKIPNSLIQLQILAAMPVSETSYDFDCGLLSLNSKIPLSYLRLFFSFIIPIVFFVGYIIIAIILKICSHNSKISFPKHSIAPAILFIILYTQPNFLYYLVLLGSCRKIGSQYYTNENSNLKCYDEIYNLYAFKFVIPLTILVSLIIPLILFFILFKNRKNLYDISFLIKFGFLYQEYKPQFYFWEFIKIIQKTIFMVVLSFFKQLYATKGYLVLFTILIYQALCFKLQPYKKPEINQLDFMQASVCSFSIFISLSILQTQFEQIKDINILLMIAINGLFIYRVIYQILKQFFSENIHKLSKYYYKYSFLKKIFKFLNIDAPPKDQKLKRIFETNQQLKYKIKESLIKFKNLEEKDIILNHCNSQSSLPIYQNSPDIVNQQNNQTHSNFSIDENIQSKKKIENMYAFQIENLDLEAKNKNCQNSEKK
ncbi:hypothetical protein ABPG72_016633 [Tetrahymena utriculariae]